jgi:capsular exopolysaccharide synthesis family protein
MEEDAPISNSRTAFVSAFFTQLDHYKRLLFRFCWIPILAVGVSVWVQSLMLKHVPPSFVSEGRMILNVKVSIPQSGVYVEPGLNFEGTQMDLMRSATVRNRVSKALSKRAGLHPAPVNIEVALSAKTSIFNLRATGEDPEYTQAYLQATMDEYRNVKRELFADASTTYLSSMSQKLDQIGKDLQTSKDDVRNFQKSNSVVFLQPRDGNKAADDLRLLTKDMDDLKFHLELFKANSLDQNLEWLASQNTNSESVANQLPPSILPNSSTNAAEGRDLPVYKLPLNLGEFEQRYLETSQDVKRLTARRDDLISQGITNTEKAPELTELNKAIAQKEIDLKFYREQSMAQMETRQHMMAVEIKLLQDRIADKKAETLDINTKMEQLKELQDTQSRLQARFDEMQSSYQTLDVDKGIGQESVGILEPATPAMPVYLEKVKHLVMAGLVGMVLGLGIVVFIDRLDDRPRTFAEVEKLFNKPVLGQFPLMKVKNKKLGVPILQVNDARYPLVEASHSLRSALLYQDSFERLPKDQPKSIVITSARPNDGKSMVSANFAITLAQTGARVLLIDADLRRGVLHKHFSVGMSPGFAEALAHQCPWSSAVVPTAIPNLQLLPCGTSPRNPSNLFAGADKLLKEMESSGNYDYYLFDTTPVLVGDDVLSLAPHVDGLLMVIRAGFTSGRIAQAALDLLRLRGVNVMGLVFNAVNPKTSDYYYYRYKEYYPEPPAR